MPALLRFCMSENKKDPSGKDKEKDKKTGGNVPAKEENSGKGHDKESTGNVFRNKDIPNEIEANSSEWPLIKTTFARRIAEAQKFDKDNGDENMTSYKNACAVWDHALSTAGFCYQYYNEFIKPDKEMKAVRPVDMYLAAVYFNYYKLLTNGAEHQDLTPDENRELIKKQIDSNRSIKEGNAGSNTLKYLFVEDRTYQYAHEVIFVANTLDNLLCLKTEDGEYLSLFSVFQILSGCSSFNPAVVKNFEKLLVGQVRDSSDVLKITFSSAEEKNAFTGLTAKIRNSVLAAITEAMGNDEGDMEVNRLNDDSDEENRKKDRQLIIFESNPSRPQQFYDKRTKTLYSLT